jgi:hypothetical protein
MSGLAQFLLIVVISTLTFLITVVTIQVFKLIQEARMTVHRLNQLLENTQTISESAARPIAAVNQFFAEVKDLVDNTETKIVNETPDRVITTQKSTAPTRRFFHRAGQMLHPAKPS